MNLLYLFQWFLNQFSPFAAFLAISSFLYVALGKSRMFHFHPIPRLILSTILGLYTANSFAFDFARIISIAGTVATIGLIGILVWHVAPQRGKGIIVVGPARFELATSGLDMPCGRGRQRPRFTTLKQAYWYPVGDISLPRPS